jgi:hypothetical protein
MTLVAKSDHSTGNSKYASYVLRSGDLTFTFTAPYSRKCAAEAANSDEPLPDYDQQQAMDFVCTHGMAVRSVGEAAMLGLDDGVRAWYVSHQCTAVSRVPGRGGGRVLCAPCQLLFSYGSGQKAVVGIFTGV